MKDLHIVHLYPVEMNIYGDTGNRIIIQRRAEWRGIKVKITHVGVGQDIPDDVDIILGGGGQDANQSVVEQDLQEKKQQLQKLADQGVVMLMICGMYQLFGKEFITGSGAKIKGVNILPLTTRAGQERLIGNIEAESKFGHIVGYENHSGLTYLDDTSKALSVIKRGAGNNGFDQTEGCIIQNVFGSYLHGPFLSKNPRLADELLRRALERKYGSQVKLKELDDSLEYAAAQIASSRPR